MLARRLPAVLARVVGRRYESMEASIAAAYKDTSSAYEGKPRHLTSIQFSIDNQRPGALLDTLTPFRESDVNVISITSRQSPDTEKAQAITIFLDLDGHISMPNVKKAIDQVRKHVIYLQIIHSCTIPWYATDISHFDLFGNKVLAGGEELSSDHPGFQDKVYKERRNQIADQAKSFKYGDKVPATKYTPDEIKTWNLVWDELMELYPTHACREYMYNFALMVENCGYRPDNIPQLEDISRYLQYRTGFSIRPVTGLLSPRTFLNALAFRVFHSTQYVRHSSQPFYTPEPDVIHELMGHAVLFADPDFADFTQTIGMASLGATDDEITKLASCYWFSVEFGLCKQEGQIKAYGAGILGSVGELKYSLKGPGDGTEENGPIYIPWEPAVAAVTEYPITTIQPRFFVADSFADATKKMQDFAQTFHRPFTLEYNAFTKCVKTKTKNSEAYLKSA
ncbi:Protein henna [Diplonema papillatum]|nr:Protein henna [Diplonema papillatum]